ncbi:TrkH family potassium uptake protein [Halocynthiibacter namhaensis]|uniref:TrkH family potassium uptake protein n=1 Tax=Halocynthiibacter namhaensis TaxID=1290553 RepID=UPI0005795EFE|nr:potassium transporter TrkG [Halocynthiibacter namhaensis]
MMTRILSLPFMVILMGIASLLMFPVAMVGVYFNDSREARVFLYGGILFLILTALIAIATEHNKSRSVLQSHLLALAGAWTLLPIMLAVPFYESLRNTAFLNAYFEMLSAFTTTGATLFDDPDRLSRTLHFWRSLVGWMGGFFIWVVAISILAPLNLGGFEVTARSRLSRTGNYFNWIGREASPAKRLSHHAAHLAPIYGGLTAALAFFLFVSGENAFIAICHAMATLSTSGISPVGGLAGGNNSFASEALIFIFLFFAISRLTFAPETQRNSLTRLSSDPEFLMGILLVLAVPTLLFLRHWWGAFEFNDQENTTAAFNAFWGAAFTVLSFLTTTGFESTAWSDARGWSGLPTPGLIMVGLATVGGGVATTAGGVKLLRVFALYRHGVQEMETLVHPHIVSGSGENSRHLGRQGAYMAWIFFMLMAVSIALASLGLALTGLDFETSFIFAVSSLSTTGPLPGVAMHQPLSWADMSGIGKAIAGTAMVLGRMETLAVIALLNPGFWRR